MYVKRKCRTVDQMEMRKKENENECFVYINFV